MQRPGGVGGHELDLHPLAGAEVEAGVVGLALADDVGEDVVEPGGCQVEVDEPGACDLDLGDVRRRVGRQGRGQLRRQLAGVELGRLGGGEGHVGGPVAVLPARGSLERDGGGRLDADRVEGAAQGRFEDVADHVGVTRAFVRRKGGQVMVPTRWSGSGTGCEARHG